jgi:hypothetical protein
MIKELVNDGSWDVVIDDDGTGEIADIVALKVEGSELLVNLVHCKFSSEDLPGARVDDLYVVCGQAEKCVRWRRDISLLFQQLIRRERGRVQRGMRSGMEIGTAESLYSMEEQAQLLRPRFTVGIAQPGLSKAKISTPQLHLLACTQVYLYETANSSLAVYCSQ